MNTTLEYQTENLVPCCYVNGTSKSKILRISESFNPYLEKVVLPGTKFYFKAQPEAFLEVYGSDIISSILEDRIICSHLQVEPK